MRRVVSSTELERSFDDLLDQVVAGEELVVERDGVPVAQLVPTARAAGDVIGAGSGRSRQAVSDDELIRPVLDEI